MRTGGMPRRRATAVGIVTALLGALVAVQVSAAGPAAAALSGAEVKGEITAFDSQPLKTISAFCPQGKRVTGGGGRVTGGAGRVALIRLQPVHTNNLDRFEVAAAEVEGGYDGTWSVEAIAICADPLPDQQVVDTTAPDGGLSFREALTRCPVPGRGRITGAGGRITGGQGQVVLAAAGQGVTGQSDGSRAAGVEDPTGFSGSWSVTTYAVCTSIDTGTVTRRARGPIDSTSPKIVDVRCSPGQSVTSGGGELFGLSLVHSPVVLEAVVPDVLPGGLPGSQVRVIARESTPTNDEWTVNAHAFCAR